MSFLKLSTLAPIPISTTKSHKFDKLMRPSASASPSSATTRPSISLPAITIPQASSTLKGKNSKRPLLFTMRRHTMLLNPCAQLGNAARVKTSNIRTGFAFPVKNRILNWFSPFSSSEREAEGKPSNPAAASSPLDSASSETVAAAATIAALETPDNNMGHESNRNDVVWCEKDVVPSLSSSSLPKKHSEHDDEKKRSKLLTLPTILTLCRVAAVPIFVGTFYIDTWWGRAATTIIFIAAAITDWLDGYLARKMRLGTAFGAFLDPVADKLMVAATLVLLCSRPMEAAVFGDVPWLFPVPAIAIIGREITMSAVREWAASQDNKLLEAVAVNNLGKWKTATQMTALTILLAARQNSEGILVDCGVVLLYISAGLAVWSLVVYMRNIWKVLR
ncbi:hypothetical protein Ancab_001418 [Ancistrocladus abbreviatus]